MASAAAARFAHLPTPTPGINPHMYSNSAAGRVKRNKRRQSPPPLGHAPRQPLPRQLAHCPGTARRPAAHTPNKRTPTGIQGRALLPHGPRG